MATTVIVPGLCGSTLRRVLSGTSLGVDLWMPYLMLNPIGMNNLRLDGQGANPAYPSPGTTIIPTGLLSAYYRPAYDFFTSKGKTLTFPYDWRLGSAQNGALLATFLAGLLATDQVYVVCHSNGGLVMRQADALLATNPNRNNLLRVVQVATPNFGSWEAPRNLAAIPSWVMPYAMQMTRAPLSVALSAALVYVQGLISHFRSVYELLPDAWSGPFASNPTTLKLYSLLNWSGINDTVNQFLLNWGASFSQALTAPPEIGKYVAVAGYNTSTVASLDDITDLPDPHAYGYTPDGDGVVTVQSAILPGVHTIFTTERHAYILLDANVRNAIWDACVNGLGADVFV